MLEQILTQINENLKRVADALETQNIDTLAEIVHETAKPFRTTETTKEAKDAKEETVQEQINVAPVTVAPSVIPTSTIEESFTQEQLAVAMSNAVSAGKMDTILGILGQFNAQALTQVDPKDYNKLATMLKEAGVKV